MSDPFDANCPFNRVADGLRKRVAEIVGAAMSSKDYKSLGSVEQIEAVMCGITVGLVGVCFAHIENAGRDAMIEAIIEYLPQAREQAEGIMESIALQ